MVKLKIALVVHGRIQAFDLARELIKCGHEVSLLTNYPRWAVTPFGVPRNVVRSCWIHGALSRLNLWLHQKLGFPYVEALLHTWFGRWAARQIRGKSWDVAICWSGIAEESFQALKGSRTVRFLERVSSHIRVQARILEEEQLRTGSHLEQPSSWMIAREEREYALADCIVVPSSFAHDTFLKQGISAKSQINPLGVQLEAFRPDSSVVESRCERIRSGKPLRILYVGAISFRKGFWDILDILRRLEGRQFQFRLVGPTVPEVQACFSELRRLAELVPKQPQRELPRWYAWGDLFVFPTVEDGYGMVLDQALASALPVLTTTNCAGPDLIREDRTGWILPVRRPDLFVERLLWCQSHREELADKVRRIYEEYRPRDWAEAAKGLEALCIKSLKGRSIEREQQSLQ